MTPEGRVKKKVNAVLNSLGADCWRFMPVQMGYGSPALDYLICYRGRFIAIETKAKGKKPTPLQLRTKAEMEAAGALVLIVDDDDSLAIALQIILFERFDDGQEAHNPDQRSRAVPPKVQRRSKQHLRQEQSAQAPHAPVGRVDGTSRAAS